jgi:hypothetical protein
MADNDYASGNARKESPKPRENLVRYITYFSIILKHLCSCTLFGWFVKFHKNECDTLSGEMVDITPDTGIKIFSPRG